MRDFPRPSLQSRPAALAAVPASSRPAPDGTGLRVALVYGAWALVATAAHLAGAVPLPAGAGLILVMGGALTLGLFMGLRLLPVTEQPSTSTLAGAQSLMGIIWASLYIWFTGGSASNQVAAGGAVLGVGMYLSAIALALPATRLAVLGRLMLVAGLASLVLPLLQRTGSGNAATAGGLLAALLPSVVLIVLLGAMHLAARSLARAREELQARNAELQAGIERMARSAERDHLTNSYNRQSILEMVGREKSRADRSGGSLCICLLDIDHFKDMNDRFGHQAGDRILAAFARRVRGALRTMDVLNSGGLPTAVGSEEAGLATRSALGRVGGEEFIVLLPETSLRGALRCAERVRKAVVRRPFDGLHQVTVSIGIAEYRSGETVSSLIGRADAALYGAKHAGRNRVHCATADGGPNAIVMPDLLAQ